MDQTEKKQALFKDFPPATKQEWKEKIIQDLKGADYNKKLVWRTIEGFDVEPIYSKEDLPNTDKPQDLPGIFPYVRGNKTHNIWHIRQDIKVTNIQSANKKALDILMKGVTSLGFIIDQKFEPTKDELEKLCENIYADAVELNFVCFHNSLKVVRDIESLVKKYNRQLDKIYGSVDFDPIGQFVLKGKFPVSEEDSFDTAKQLIEAAKHLPNFKVIAVNGSYFHNSGSGIVQELAFSLAQGVGYLTQLTERGLSINQIAPRMKFQFAIGSNYFMEIAKIRAARMLWAHIVKAYGTCDNCNTQMFIHSVTSNWNKTVYDAYVNMLRTTTEAMSGITGGTDSLTVLPFNSVYEESTAFSERIARSQQLLLKEESYMDKVADPAAGSYYIENLTQSIASQAWELFLKVQEKGGFLEAFKAGFIQEEIKTTADRRHLDIATRKEILLGTNQYPNTGEYLEKDFDRLRDISLPKNEKPDNIEVLKPTRGASAFEQLRIQTDKYALNAPRPRVFRITMGNLGMSRARSQFAGNFFGCAGYEIIDNNGFKTVEEAAKACLKAKASIAVICSSDEEYTDLVPKLYKLLHHEMEVVVAGYPQAILDDLRKCGVVHFIHIKSNVLETLGKFQEILKINE
ncbi:MAG: acyl-CoA mutase large subunit family protein [Bacteroidales bacterium]|nr:acyl-CoA mutase large subunit family protein [Bacteroidales bacterium]MCF8403712.1 acyl-CoA mutase large subunit family protein [Bacteroidales bacterium]